MTVARDTSRTDDRIDSSHLDPAAGHTPERVCWTHEREEHDAQKGVHEGIHLVDSTRCLFDRGVRHQLREPGHEEYQRSDVSFVLAFYNTFTALGKATESQQWILPLHVWPKLSERASSIMWIMSRPRSAVWMPKHTKNVEGSSSHAAETRDPRAREQRKHHTQLHGGIEIRGLLPAAFLHPLSASRK